MSSVRELRQWPVLRMKQQQYVQLLSINCLLLCLGSTIMGPIANWVSRFIVVEHLTVTVLRHTDHYRGRVTFSNTHAVLLSNYSLLEIVLFSVPPDVGFLLNRRRLGQCQQVAQCFLVVPPTNTLSEHCYKSNKLLPVKYISRYMYKNTLSYKFKHSSSSQHCHQQLIASMVHIQSYVNFRSVVFQYLRGHTYGHAEMRHTYPQTHDAQGNNPTYNARGAGGRSIVAL